MQKRLFITTGVAAVAAVIGLIGMTGQGRADNVSLEALSGDALANDPTILLVDIRRPEEWQQTGVVEGALLVTYTGPDAFLAAITPKLGKGQRLALICRSGNRTSRAASQIASLIDTPVIDVAGGMIRVVGQGYQPVKPSRDMGCTVC